MKIKLLLDEDVHAALVEQLRRRGIDTIHVQEVNRKGETDPEQLEKNHEN
jgi:predicted nuclease of predicted toxin-antitoxin system